MATPPIQAILPRSDIEAIITRQKELWKRLDILEQAENGQMNLNSDISPSPQSIFATPPQIADDTSFATLITTLRTTSSPEARLEKLAQLTHLITWKQLIAVLAELPFMAERRKAALLLRGRVWNLIAHRPKIEQELGRWESRERRLEIVKALYN
ncbi:uncharacterized protein VTP21DRAFT_10883 [Calcarisporiella thermophila]|uniref:uncharacterized protein n=1 Tax=Calcarisporiella thermophila TaxID=911321 RepID=UPI0037421A99